MIKADQPTLLPSGFNAVVSSIHDGSIRYPALDPNASQNIAHWYNHIGIPLEQTVGMYITYGNNRTYTDIVEIDAPVSERGATVVEGWIQADVLVTRCTSLALLLPVADCNAVVYADSVHSVIAIAHLGWHSTVNDLAAKVVDYFRTHYKSNPADIIIYNSPSIRVESYIFTHLGDMASNLWHQPPYATRRSDGTFAIDLARYNYDQWIGAGILPEHIEVTNVDTAMSDNYPSHFAGAKTRFALTAWMNE